MPKRLITDFDVEDMLDKIYLLRLSHNVASETYVWSFQYRLFNYIQFTKVKLLKIGLLLTDTFCNLNEETPYLNALTYKLFGNASLIGRQMSLVKI